MSFFAPQEPEPVHEPSPAPPTPVWQRPPQDEIPVPVAMSRPLAQVPGAALTMTRIDVHREGIAFKIRLDLRITDDLDPDRRNLLTEVLSPRSRSPRDTGFRIGVTVGDGGTAEVDVAGRGFSFYTGAGEPEPPHLTAVGQSGSGGPDGWSTTMSLWLWPLPPAGDLTLHFVSDAVGIPEGLIVIDTAPLRDAVHDVFDVWGHPTI